MRSSNTVKHKSRTGRKDRERLLEQKGVLLWLTGLSGSGKSTIAYALEERLITNGNLSYVLDGDNIRHGLNGDLEFSAEDREENIRRIGEVGRLFVEAGLITIASFISPFRKDRDKIRSKLAGGSFLEIYVKCPLEVCEQRDVKGLYGKARKGEIGEFTGISAPYEEPLEPEIVIESDELSLDQAVDLIFQFLKEQKIIEV